MIRDISHTLIDQSRIAARVRELAAEIVRAMEHEHGVKADDEDARIILVPIMTGAMVFVADLIRQLPFKLRMELLTVSSYPGKSVESKGIALKGDLPTNLAGAHVLLVDDILDSGQTLSVVSRMLRERGCESLRTCVLLRKPGKAKVDFTPEHVGFDIPDEFVVGYGLDYDGHYRNLPEIAVLKALAANGASGGASGGSLSASSGGASRGATGGATKSSSRGGSRA